MNQMEIVAPAGGMESLIAAVNSGADAVYMGYGDLNARRNAQNFSQDTFAEGVAYCHARGVRVLLTLNTVVYDKEFSLVAQVAEMAARHGVDAVIVQDIGVAAYLKKAVPQMPIHASTQMTVHNLSGAMFLKEQGFRRIVLAREMSKEEIFAVTSQVDIETEVFVHGALCMCVSGQCYMSSMLGERSGNRGLCAQPCRLPFSGTAQKEEYGLSLKDVSLIPKLEELSGLGVTSVKIEGRMKRPEYVAAAVSACRMALRGETPNYEELRAVFSRSGFTDGYFTGKTGTEMFGTRGREDVVSAAGVLKKLNHESQKEYPKIEIVFTLKMEKDQPVTLTVEDWDKNTATALGEPPQIAQNKPTTLEMAEKSLGKLGGTFYFLKEINGEIEEGLMVPVSVLNDLRRRVLEELTQLRQKANPKEWKELSPKDHPKQLNRKIPVLRGRFHSADQLTPAVLEKLEYAALPFSQLTVLAKHLPKEMITKLCWQTPRVTFGDDKKALKKKLTVLKELGIDKMTIPTIGTLSLAKENGFTPLGDFGLNITNSLALEAYSQWGLRDATVSYELALQRIRTLGDYLPYGIIGYGKLPLMLTRNCPLKTANGCGSCNGQRQLFDRRGNAFFVECGDREYAEILNTVPIFLADRMNEWEGLSFMTLYFTDESSEECAAVVESYLTHSSEKRENITRGLYYRNVL